MNADERGYYRLNVLSFRLICVNLCLPAVSNAVTWTRSRGLWIRGCLKPWRDGKERQREPQMDADTTG
jgi:hypothetical protein